MNVCPGCGFRFGGDDPHVLHAVYLAHARYAHAATLYIREQGWVFTLQLPGFVA